MEEIRVNIKGTIYVGYFKFIRREGYRESIIEIYYNGECVNQYEVKNEKVGVNLAEGLLRIYLLSKLTENEVSADNK